MYTTMQAFHCFFQRQTPYIAEFSLKWGVGGNTLLPPPQFKWGGHGPPPPPIADPMSMN